MDQVIRPRRQNLAVNGNRSKPETPITFSTSCRPLYWRHFVCVSVTGRTTENACDKCLTENVFVFVRFWVESWTTCDSGKLTALQEQIGPKYNATIKFCSKPTESQSFWILMICRRNGAGQMERCMYLLCVTPHTIKWTATHFILSFNRCYQIYEILSNVIFTETYCNEIRLMTIFIEKEKKKVESLKWESSKYFLCHLVNLNRLSMISNKSEYEQWPVVCGKTIAPFSSICCFRRWQSENTKEKHFVSSWIRFASVSVKCSKCLSTHFNDVKHYLIFVIATIHSMGMLALRVH